MNIHVFIYRLFVFLFGYQPIYTGIRPLQYLKNIIRNIPFVWSMIASILLSFHPSVQDAKARIDAYEQAGHYDQALEIARATQKKLLNSNFDKASGL